MPLRYLVLLPTAKAAIMVATVEAVVEPSFLSALAIAAVSATLSGMFLLIATHMNLKRAVKPNEELKQAVEEKMDQQSDTP
jgi:sensor c-di-GMP phosphodiesterase-like protein